jgi:hypothetical protein
VSGQHHGPAALSLGKASAVLMIASGWTEGLEALENTAGGCGELSANGRSHVAGWTTLNNLWKARYSVLLLSYESS